VPAAAGGPWRHLYERAHAHVLPCHSSAFHTPRDATAAHKHRPIARASSVPPCPCAPTLRALLISCVSSDRKTCPIARRYSFRHGVRHASCLPNYLQTSAGGCTAEFAPGGAGALWRQSEHMPTRLQLSMCWEGERCGECGLTVNVAMTWQTRIFIVAQSHSALLTHTFSNFRRIRL
jgi:hypothetical protein